MHRSKTPWCIAAALPALIAAAAFGAEATKGVRILTDHWATRSGVSSRVLQMIPERPRAGVMLVPGGHGNINVDVQANIGWGEDDFVIRTRARYPQAGFTTIVLDVASDRKPPVDITNYRRSPEQADDLRAISAQLRRMADPMFVVAYDRGAMTALNAAGRGKLDVPAGLVLISPVLDKDPVLNEGARFALERLPVLVIHHDLDQCSAEPVNRLKQIAAVVTPRNFEAVGFGGGSDDFLMRDPLAYPGDPCNKQAHHALVGLEDRVTATILEWLDKRVSASP